MFQRRAMLTVGVLLLLISAFGFYTKIESPPYGVSDLSAQIATLGSNGKEECKDKATITIRLALEVPTTAYVNDSIVPKVSAVVVSSIPTGASAALNVHLSGAGLEIDPANGKDIKLTESYSIPWTVRAKEAGHYQIVAEAVGNDPCQTVSIVPSDTIIVPLGIHKHWYLYLQDEWPVISGFFGTFLTAPGILAFYDARKRRKRRAKANRNVGIHK